MKKRIDRDAQKELRDSFREKAEMELREKFGREWRDLVGFDLDYGDTGDDTMGVDAYVYFDRDDKVPMVDGDAYDGKFTPDPGLYATSSEVKDICNIIGKAVDPKWDYGKNGEGVAEWEYDDNGNWVRAYLCLTVPDVVLARMDEPESLEELADRDPDEFNRKMDSWREIKESKKLTNEGPGAGYDISIEGLKIDKVLKVDNKTDKKGDYFEVTASIAPGDYKVTADGYYDRFFPIDEYEEDTVHIDNGLITIELDPTSDDDDGTGIEEEVEGVELDINYMYGGGWSHSYLPEDGKIVFDDRINIKNDDIYFYVSRIELVAPDMAAAINSGYDAAMDTREEAEDIAEE